MLTKRKPGIFLAQPKRKFAPFNTLEGLCKQMAEWGYRSVQIPSWDGDLVDLWLAATSKTYLENLVGQIKSWGVTDGISEFATHLFGQLVVVHKAYSELFDGFAPETLRGHPEARTEWAKTQMKLAIAASANLRDIEKRDKQTIPSFTGSRVWPFIYPWPQRDAALVAEAYDASARDWAPLLQFAHSHGITKAWELHPGEDAFSGKSFRRFKEACRRHCGSAADANKINLDVSHIVLMAYDYLLHIDQYGEDIEAFHVKDAELLQANGDEGVYSVDEWPNSNRRFRNPGDGQVDFGAIKKRFEARNIDVQWVVEWECCKKRMAQGVPEAAKLVEAVLNGLPLPARTEPDGEAERFDDFAGGGADLVKIRKIIGVG
jgi:sugar phosphate isomerase/epimerase